MDFNKLKVFGFPRHVTQYNVYNPSKIRYLKSKQYGYFECPKLNKNPEIQAIVYQYKKRLEYEKYMNPKGYKLSWTSNFPKVGDTIDFVNLKCFLVRSGKKYEPNEIKFLVDKNTSKPEIKQFIEKLYNIKVNKIDTAILPGQVRLNYKNPKQRSFMRTRDIKKAVIQLDFNTDESYRRIS